MGKGKAFGAFNLMSLLVMLCACFSLLYDQWLRGVDNYSVHTFVSLLFLLSGFWMCQHVVLSFLKKKQQKKTIDQSKL